MMRLFRLGGNAQLAQMHQMVQHAVHQIAARAAAGDANDGRADGSVGAMQGHQMSVAAQQMAQQFGAMQMAGRPWSGWVRRTARCTRSRKADAAEDRGAP